MPALSHVASTRAVPSPGRRGLWMVLMLSLAACATAAPTPKALPPAPMDAVLADAVGPEGYLGTVAVVAERGTVRGTGIHLVRRRVADDRAQQNERRLLGVRLRR